jgi:hypothetical protein
MKRKRKKTQIPNWIETLSAPDAGLTDEETSKKSEKREAAGKSVRRSDLLSKMIQYFCDRLSLVAEAERRSISPRLSSDAATRETRQTDCASRYGTF